jgi:hypothetical protein
MAVYEPVRHQKSFGPYNIFLVTDRSIYRHMTLSAMNYLLYIFITCCISIREGVVSFIHVTMNETPVKVAIFFFIVEYMITSIYNVVR